ncbi:MAG: DUF1080 domain-containing protein [Tannerella sp.]|jgi:hypothetical protein|nr:DUF1080 domain-containing protein [Tannerella sp.]
MKRFKITLVALMGLIFAVSAQKPVSLFDGKTLNGWKLVTCEAEVVDGAILLKAGNGFLLADKQYADFVLECDWKALNLEMWDSGIYFRSESLPEEGARFPWPRQYQINLKKGEEGAVEGVDKEKCSAQFKKGDWNHFKLTVKGDTAELEFNGVKVWTKSGFTPAKGYLCLQAEVPAGGQYLFKNITMLEL